MSKKNLTLGGVLVLLVGMAWFYQGPFKDSQKEMKTEKNFLSSLNVDEIDKIEVTKKETTTVLTREGDEWKIAGTKDFYAQNGSTIKTKLIDAVAANIELASNNADKKQEFETGNEGTRLKLMKGDDTLAEITIGKMGNDYGSSYISPAGSDKTYLLKTNLTSTFAREDWYDKTIFASSPDNIKKIRFQYPGNEFIIEKQGTSTDADWKGIAPREFKVDKEKLEQIINIMSNLYAPKIPAQTFDGTGLVGSKIIVQATGEGVDNTIMVGNASKDDEELYYAKKGSSDNIYLIRKEQMEELNKNIKDLQ